MKIRIEWTGVMPDGRSVSGATYLTLPRGLDWSSSEALGAMASRIMREAGLSSPATLVSVVES